MTLISASYFLLDSYINIFKSAKCIKAGDEQTMNAGV